ncbi:hypothetical protein FRB93_005535 [Tulasnella sp. JGI-2019a]|nr:hypothetical protein FRB93_005535 [Tulasnella sp. JGI-2019a]
MSVDVALAASDEREPLLTGPGDSKIPNYTQSPEDAVFPEGQLEDQLVESVPLLSPEEKRSWSNISWHIFLGFLAILVVVVFVKAFIDAGDVEFDLRAALKRALGGGLSGAAAMILQVLTLMPLRTVMNYQYRYGTTTTEAVKTLYHDGGYGRYYRGLTPALFQGPVARFGDTAANAGILALMQSNKFLRSLPIFIQTIFASLCAAAFRMILTPVDTLKTTMQTEGRHALGLLKRRIKERGIGSLWYGAFATAAATFVGHYPWFFVYNFLSANLWTPNSLFEKLVRQAIIGFSASVVSDSISNSLRVIKTYRQVHESDVSYTEAAREVIRTDGVRGLLGRGLKTRILANGLQGLLFSILWKLFLDLWDSKAGK